MADDTPRASESKASLGETIRQILTGVSAKIFPAKENQLAPLKQQLLHAGFYHPQSLGVFLGGKLVLMLVLPLIAAALPYAAGSISLRKAIVVSFSATAFGMIAPGYGWKAR